MSDKKSPILRADPPAATSAVALPDRSQLAVIALERTRMPTVVTDPRQPDNPIVLANKAFLDLTGYSADEVIGRNCRFLQGEATSPECIQELRDAIATQREVSVEMINYRKDGSGFWNQLSISPVEDEDGNLLYYFGTQKDVTERRRAQGMEETERVLLKEVDHRAMNALAVVQSIVRLSRADSIAGYASAIQGRVDALARAHRLLAGGGWAGAGLGELVRMEAAAGGAAKLDADGPPTHLSARVVQPIALALHELMSNAVAHGSLSQPGGSVIVRWWTASGQVQLDWREIGCHAPAPKPGFGLNLIQGVIGRQLRGDVSLAWAQDGLKALFTFAPGEPARTR